MLNIGMRVFFCFYVDLFISKRFVPEQAFEPRNWVPLTSFAVADEVSDCSCESLFLHRLHHRRLDLLES